MGWRRTIGTHANLLFVHLSGHGAVAMENAALRVQLAAANPLWRAPRMHGELKMLGIAVPERTVS